MYILNLNSHNVSYIILLYAIFQANFGEVKRVETIATQGRPSRAYAQWVTSYKFAYSVTDVEPYIFTLDPACNEKVFDGNTDQNSVVNHDLETTVEARCVRLYPQTWEAHISLRWEVYGCDVGN